MKHVSEIIPDEVCQRFDDYAGQDVRNLRPTKTRADLDFVT